MQCVAIYVLFDIFSLEMTVRDLQEKLSCFNK